MEHAIWDKVFSGVQERGGQVNENQGSRVVVPSTEGGMVKTEAFISSGLKKRIISSYSIGAMVAAHPFEYDKTSGLCRRIAGKRIYLWYFNLVLAHSHCFFIVMRTGQTVMTPGETLENKMFMIVWSGIMFLTISAQHIIRKHGEEICLLCNQAVAFFDRFGKHLEVDRNKDSRRRIAPIIAFALRGWVYGCIFAIPAAASYVFYDPEMQLYPTSMLKNPSMDVLRPVQVVCVVYFVYTLYVLLSDMLLVASNCLIFGFLISMALGTIGKNKREALVVKLSKDKDLKWYKEIEILQMVYNSAYSPSYLPIVDATWAIMVIIAILAIVTASGLKAFISIFNGICAMFLFTTTFRPLANVFVNSGNILGIWGKYCETGADRKILRSLRPVRALVGSYFYVDPMLVLTVMNIIVTQSIGILLLDR